MQLICECDKNDIVLIIDSNLLNTNHCNFVYLSIY